jgi:hypothetical protein
MTDQNAIRDDIAFMRALAEEGRSGPLLGGAIMMTGGGLFGTASLFIWIALSNGISPDSWVQFVWPISGVVFFAAFFVLLRRTPMPKSGAARGVGIAWSAAGWTMFILIASLIVMAVRLDDNRIMGAICPAILALYGCSWFIAASASGRRWLYAVTFGAFAMALVTAWFAMQVVDYLIYAISLFALVAAPGLVLMRQARKAQA